MNSFRAVVTGTALVFVLVLFVGPAVAADLCPPPTPPITDSDDRRMREENFSAKDFAEALSYFEEDLPQALRNKARTEDVRNSESYKIGYPNVMTTIKGYVLRQDMLLRLAERDLTVEKSRRGRAIKADVASANARFQEAKQRFCDFLKNALYSD